MSEKGYSPTASRFCPNCGAYVSNEFHFCSGCGIDVNAQRTTDKIESIIRPQITCPNCGQTNPDDFRFCTRCGSDFDRHSTLVEFASVKKPSERCPKCGKNISKESKFCPNCGTSNQTGLFPHELNLIENIIRVVFLSILILGIIINSILVFFIGKNILPLVTLLISLPIFIIVISFLVGIELKILSIKKRKE